MEVGNSKQPLSMQILALHGLLNITTFSKDALHVWTQQELLNIFLGPCRKLRKKRSKVQELLERLVEKKTMHSMKFHTDNKKHEVIIYWIPPLPVEKGSERDVQAMDVDQEQKVEKIDLRTPERVSKRISLGAKTQHQSMASIISKTRAKLSGLTPTSTPTGRSSPITSGKRTPLSSSRRLGKQMFKSPLVQSLSNPEIKALTEQRRQLEKNIEDNANNENLIKIWRKASQEAAEFLFSKIPKQSSFLESEGFSESWGNSNWGWDDSDESKGKQRREYSDQEDNDDEYETRRGNIEQKNTMKYMLIKMGINIDLIKWNDEDECFEE
ncbi:15238_t:CDS:2 [Acaulospora morrowiae]|uniref:15238_t:CDS:1 n=1 Tax=Acaulospora morrowiae TaxID=94023 RepID=A0A9N9C0M3_9GLOM|nr:15238_t:CDS:2 [Acaulospora morrowiae]